MKAAQSSTLKCVLNLWISSVWTSHVHINSTPRSVSGPGEDQVLQHHHHHHLLARVQLEVQVKTRNILVVAGRKVTVPAMPRQQEGMPQLVGINPCVSATGPSLWLPMLTVLGHSFILSNIARLITQSGRMKSGFLFDQTEIKNADYVAVCETWLHDGVKDAEVTLDFPNFTLFRADRGLGPDGNPRVGGGVALYLKDEFSGDCLATYDNGVVEMLVVKIHQLDSIVVVLYRPPDTTASELQGALKCLDETLSSISAPLPAIVLCGDFNLGSNAVTWRTSNDGDLIPIIAGHREGETSKAKQATMIIDLCQKFGMLQQVNTATRQVTPLLNLTHQRKKMSPDEL